MSNVLTSAEHIRKVAKEVSEVVVERNKKYGDNNLITHGHIGLIVRISDKLARIDNMKDLEKKEEIIKSLKNDYLDIAGYGIMGLKLMEENKL